MVSAALMREAVRETVQRGFTHYLTDVFEGETHRAEAGAAALLIKRAAAVFRVWLADEAREAGATTIFFEALVSPDVAETLAKEVGAKTAVLDPLEGLTKQSLEDGDDYVSVMEANLSELRAALGCTSGN